MTKPPCHSVSFNRGPDGLRNDKSEPRRRTCIRLDHAFGARIRRASGIDDDIITPDTATAPNNSTELSRMRESVLLG